MTDKLWEIGYTEFKGGLAYFIAKDAKEAIEKFEAQYRLGWIDLPYTVISVRLLGSVTI